ncbi:MAG TPA: lysophospholipid acyltransferase family protein [Planctomycetaceae bacterium]|nr:lysophospholipid acyltransferase family protein [Planctomycetaceae bacterium]
MTHGHPTRRNWYWLSIQFLLRFVFTVWLKYRARGVEKIPSTGGGLIVANHQSFLDPLLIGLPLSRPVSYVARDTLFPVPLIGWILRNAYVMPINRQAAGSATIRAAVERMQQGFLVGIFPEGTRCRRGEVGEFRPGFAAMVRRAKLPIFPVGIAGAHEAMPRGVWWIKRRTVTVVFGDALPADEVQRYCQRGQEQRLVALVRERVVALHAAAEAWRREAEFLEPAPR